MVVRRVMTDIPGELYHHGIKGQEWGDRNGPPYPLDRETSAAVKRSAKKKSFIENYKNKKKMKKVRAAGAKARAEKARKAEELKRAGEKAREERAKRDQIVKTGDASKIQKIQSNMTNKEYENALMRVNFKATLDDYANKQNEIKKAKAMRAVDTAIKVASAAGSIAGSAGQVYDALAKMGVVEKKTKKSAIDLLTEKKDRLELGNKIKDLEYNNSAEGKKLKELQRKADKSKLQADINRNIWNANNPGNSNKFDPNQLSENDVKALKKKLGL